MLPINVKFIVILRAEEIVPLTVIAGTSNWPKDGTNVYRGEVVDPQIGLTAQNIAMYTFFLGLAVLKSRADA